MSDVPSKDCNGVLRMQVMIAKSGGSVVARYGPDRASARAFCILFTSHIWKFDHDTQHTNPNKPPTPTFTSWKFLGLQRKFTAGPKICCRR